MLKNWFLIAWRNLYLDFGFSLINILGLSMGIACCILMLLFARYESSYDSSYTGADRIYRVVTDTVPGSGDEASRNQGMFFPEDFLNSLLSGGGSGDIELSSYYGLFDRFQFSVYYRGETLLENYSLVGENFFKIIELDFIEGGLDRKFGEPGSIILSESKAKKYFGDGPALGGTLVAHGGGLLTISGVVKDFPENSHIKGSIFAGPKTVGIIQGRQLGGVFPVTGLLVRLAEGVEPEIVSGHLNDSWKTLYGDDSNANIQLIPLPEIHLDDPAIKLMTSDGAKPWMLSNRMVLSVSVVLALLILIIACFNFVNMSVARASRRGMEIGVRMVFGATRGKLFVQYLCEAIVLSVLASIVALILVWVLLPWFNLMVNRNLTMSSLFNFKTLVTLAAFTIGVGLLAGIYPAVAFSRQSPIAATCQDKSMGRHGVMRKVLVVTQFLAATLLIVIALMGCQQLEFFRHQDLGYNKDIYLLKPNLRSLGAYNQSHREQSLGTNTPSSWDRISLRLQAELLEKSAISDVSLSWLVPGHRSTGDVEIARSGDGEQKYVPVGILNNVDENFLQAYQLPLIAGRNFSSEYSKDAVQPRVPQTRIIKHMTGVKPEDIKYEGGAIILTQSTIKSLGFQSPHDALGEEILQRSPLRSPEIKLQEQGVFLPRATTAHRVVGVVGDMLLGDGIGGMKTAAFTFKPNGGFGFSIRVKPGQDREALEQIQEAIKKTVPEIFFTVEYLPEKLERSLQPFNRLMLAFIGFAILAVGISCLGLYGMATFTVARRTKEVGIRKVLGASSGRLVRLLGWDFTKPVLLAIALALPLAYIVCTYMLQAFAHKVPIGISLLGASALLSIVIAWLTVSGQTWHAANANPSESLRSE